MQEKGVITEIHGKTATVRVDKTSACEHCKGDCIEQAGSMIAEADNSAGADVGDTVRLEMDSRASLVVALVVFGTPLMSLILGYSAAMVVAYRLNYGGDAQILSICVGAGLFLLSFIPVKVYDSRIRKSGFCSAVIVEIIKRSA